MELSDEEFHRARLESFRRHVADMTPEERQSVVDRQALVLYEFEKAMAQHGMPRPGNDPEKPN
jgi:hypothetical protein